MSLQPPATQRFSLVMNRPHRPRVIPPRGGKTNGQGHGGGRRPEMQPRTGSGHFDATSTPEFTWAAREQTQVLKMNFFRTWSERIKRQLHKISEGFSVCLAAMRCQWRNRLGLCSYHRFINKSDA